jgi:hypothetical protein
MTIWIVNNGGSSPVAGETNLLQAIAEAQNGGTLTLDDMTTAALAANQGDFTFHA